MTTVLTIVFALATAVAASAGARRMLDAPVGWPRSIVVGLMVLAVGSPVVTFVADRTGLDADSFATDPWPAVLVVLLTFAWIFAVGVGILVLLEMLVPTGTVPSPLAWLQRWRANRRHSRRYAEIARIFVRRGLGLRPRRRQVVASRDDIAVALRKALTDAGVTFVKIGQLASTRPDLLPPEFIRELSTLQTQVAVVDWDAMAPVLEAGLGKPIDAVFAHVDPEPLAAASVAQVYAARLLDGREVVIKVQRPGAAVQVEVDLDILLRLAKWAERSTDWGRELGVARLAEGFAASLREELDYRVEADNMRAVGAEDSVRTFDLGLLRIDLESDRPRVLVPEVIYSSTSVLVMERMRGVALGQAGVEVAALEPEDREALATALLRECLRQILVNGAFHADLHPGNVLVVDAHTLALLDFGSVGRLDSGSRQWLGLLLLALQRADGDGVTDALLELLDRPDRLNERELRREVGAIVVRYGAGFGMSGPVSLFTVLFQLARRHGFSVPAQLAIAMRTIGTLDGTIRLLDPNFDLVAGAQRQTRPLFRRAVEPESIKETVLGELVSLTPLLARMPRHLDQLAQQVEEGRLSMNMRLFADNSDRRFVASLVSQAVITLLAVAAIIAGVVLVTSDTGPLLTPEVRLTAAVGAGVLLVGFMLGLRALITAVRRR